MVSSHIAVEPLRKGHEVVIDSRWRQATLIFLILIVVGLGGAPGQAQDAAAPTVAPVVREVLGDGEPVAAPGQSLELVRFTIAPGTTLPAHTHPGMQVAWLEAGELEYTV